MKNWIGQEILPGTVVAHAATRGSSTLHKVGVVELIRASGTARVRWIAEMKTGPKAGGAGTLIPEASPEAVGNPRVNHLYHVHTFDVEEELALRLRSEQHGILHDVAL